MILESLVQLAHAEGLLANPDYEPKPVAWIISVGAAGDFLGLVPTTGKVDSGKKPRPKMLSIPRRTGRTANAVADFLVDKSEYVLGIEPSGQRSSANLEIRRNLFRDSIRAAVLETHDAGLAAVGGFLANEQGRSLAIREMTNAGYESNDLIAFRFEDQLVHDRSAVVQYFSTTRRSNVGGGESQCLICGRSCIPVDKHPSVKVPGGTTSGVAIVSFNSEAFESFGLERNHNAPVCRTCADAYTTALGRLLSDRYLGPTGQVMSKRFVRLSADTTAVFWSDAPSPVIDLFTSYFDAPSSESVEALLRSPHRGAQAAPTSNRFYCLILSGGQGRAVLRGMHTGTVSRVESNLRKYFESVDIGSSQPLPLWMLLKSLALQGELKNLPPGLEAEMFFAIVFGWRFPGTALARAVERCRAEQKVSRERAAAIRACLIRNGMEVTVNLDKEAMSQGYRLGRLLAVLERVQDAAQNNPNKTIVDRYYGAASTRPGTVFPRLMSLTQHHLAKLKSGLASHYQSQLGEIVSGLSGFPATLNLQQQGLFAIGYYHQRQEFFKRRETEAPALQTAEGDAE